LLITSEHLKDKSAVQLLKSYKPIKARRFYLHLNNSAMENEKSKLVQRKKFIVWSVGVLSVFTAAKYFFRSTPKQKTTTVKMLTQEGKLVEVEASKLSTKRKKIKDTDIHTWVKRKSSL